MKLYRNFLYVLCFVSTASMSAINVSIDRSSVHVNESFQMFFDADQSPDDDPDFSPLQTHFIILNNSQNSSISVINGDYQRSIKWTLQLMPKQEGDITIPAIDFGDDKTEPFTISVKSPAQTTGGSGSGLIFELSADRESVPVQGQLIITMRLMSDSNIAAYEFGELVIDDIDVVTEALGEVNRFQTQLGDKLYLVLEQKFALFPQNSGSMQIKPVLGQVRLSTASRSIFDPFQSRGEIRSAHSPALNIEVSGINPAFDGQHWLPASALRISEVWQDDLGNLTAGEPVTRTIMLVAEGLTSAQLPALKQPDIDGLKQYPDQAVLNNQRSDKGIVGQLQQKIALIPTAGGHYQLPEIKIPWWNVNNGRQEIASLPARRLEVTTSEAVTAAQAETVTQLSTSDITESVAAAKQTESNRFWIWLSLFLACGWLISILLWWLNHRRRSSQSSEHDHEQVSQRKATNQLKQACLNNNARAARDALLPWAQALDTERSFDQLSQVTVYFGEPLKSQIDLMNKSLYSYGSEGWQGDSLWHSCEAIQSQLRAISTNRGEQLPALNP